VMRVIDLAGSMSTVVIPGSGWEVCVYCIARQQSYNR
jgi:hypothetical protein